MVQEKLAQEEARSHIDWPATFAGAAAAVTVAVLLSTLGAAGTLIGAAVGSVVATVSTALYKQGIESSRRRMAEVQALALQKVNLADQELRRAERRPDGPRAEQDVARARERLDEASSALAPEVEQPEQAAGPAVAAVEDAPGRWAALPWRRIALVAVAVFVLSLAAISVIEVLAGKSVSTITGGTDDDRTSITGIFGDRTGTDEPREKVTPTDPTTSPGESASTEPTPETSTTPTDATEPTPSETPTETVTVTETATEPTDEVEPTASVSP